MDNAEIARFFYEIAELLELKGANPFRIRSYFRAAQTIETLTENLAGLAAAGKLCDLPGIGESMAQKIAELLQTGKLRFYQDLKKEFPAGILELLKIPGIGPKHAARLYKELGVKNVNDLAAAARAGRIKDLPGLGEKAQQNILAGIEQYKHFSGRFTLDKAQTMAAILIGYLKSWPEVKKVAAAGSLRRWKETIGDLDILVVSQKPAKLMNRFSQMKEVKKILAQGPTKASIRLTMGLQVDLRAVAAASYGAALHYFTGSKEHNIRIRSLAITKGLKINEYGIFKVKGNKKIAGAEETEIFGTLGLDFIPPELREDRGEIAAAASHQLPKLIGLGDIKGDLHLHSQASDGVSSIEAMAEAARSRGYRYIAITDHSQSAKYAHGLEPERLLEQIKQIDKINANLANFRILKGSEVDIKPDGSLDFPEELLSKLDLVIGAVHSNFKMDRQTMTARIVKAMQDPRLKILAHPSGRLLGLRDPYQVDLEAVIAAAKKYGTILELNAHPKRLDLTDIYCQRAKKEGVLVVISTDAHSPAQLNNMAYGLATARRGWLEAKNVVNTLPLARLLARLGSTRST